MIKSTETTHESDKIPRNGTFNTSKERIHTRLKTAVITSFGSFIAEGSRRFSF